jgi:hypothetical protein
MLIDVESIEFNLKGTNYTAEKSRSSIGTYQAEFDVGNESELTLNVTVKDSGKVISKEQTIKLTEDIQILENVKEKVTDLISDKAVRITFLIIFLFILILSIVLGITYKKRTQSEK